MSDSTHRQPRPVRPRLLVGRTRKAWLTAHVGFSVGWLGAAYCMLVLGVTGLFAEDTELRIACYELMHLFDRAVNIPLGTSMLVTGLVVSLRTKWGLIRHRWVLTKFIASTLVLILAPVLSVPRVEHTIALLDAGAELGATPVEIITISVSIVATLTAMTIISIFKPWGRTRWDTATAHRRPRRGQDPLTPNREPERAATRNPR